ncbi:MAG: hypothetical protein PHU88_06715, partial [candidate division Zixibacteria bacterium]|nr:hypothetical protein [candidate division Zixibacteria bacterium]
MLKKFVSLLILTLFMFSFMAVTAGAKSRIKDERSEKRSHYGFMYGKKLMPIPRQSSPVMVKDDYRVSLGTSGDGNSPGAIVAHTLYEMQQPSSMGRQIDWRNPNPQIHMAYTQMFAVGGPRYASYNVYDPVSGTWPLTADVGCPVAPWGLGMAGGASLDVRPDGGSVVACHYRTTEGELDDYNTTVYIDQTAGSGLYCGFGSGSSAPNDSASAAMEPPPEYIWPKLEYHINGSDTVIYALSWEMVEYNLGTLVLFRNVGSNLQGSWETHIIDTIFYPNHAIASSRVSTKVACCWLEEAAEGVEGNNDVWYLVSYDMGATWNPYYKVNVTNYNPYEPGFRAWIELSCLYDSKDDLHIVWNASVYNGDGTEADSRSCRLFHWTENTDLISTIHDATWDPMLNCGMGGPNVLNIGHISISVCDSLGLDDRLYVIWSQWGDPEKGDSTDCADPIFVGFEKGANADIYMSQSNLDGLAWEVPYNLTKTKTPGCDTTTGNECDNETWSSMSRYCMDNRDWSGLDWSSASEALTVNPRPDQPEKWLFLDVFYVNDVAPGLSELVDSRSENAVNYNVPLKWFRLPYVYRKVESRMHLSPRKLNYPSYIRHGEQTKYYVTIENIGDSDLVLSDIYIEKVTYEDVDWLGIDQINMTISWGPPDNIDTLIVTVNKDGIIYSPGTIVNLVGRVALKRVIGDYGSYDTTYLPV